MPDRVITNRRNIEQILHCVQEALSCCIHGEDPGCIMDDLDQAAQLIQIVKKNLNQKKPSGADAR